MNSCHDDAILDHYQRSWAKMLVVFIGWPTDRAERWARFEIDQHRNDVFLNHEWPAYYLAPFLLRGIDPSRLWHAVGEIDFAIHGGGPGRPDLLEDAYDCRGAKQRLAEVLAKYGIDLDRLDTSQLHERWPL